MITKNWKSLWKSLLEITLGIISNWIELEDMTGYHRKLADSSVSWQVSTPKVSPRPRGQKKVRHNVFFGPNNQPLGWNKRTRLGQFRWYLVVCHKLMIS